MALVTVTPLRGGDGNRPIYIPRLNQEAEQGLLGAILCDNHYFHRIAGMVSERQFGIGVHARLWTELERRIAVGLLANPVTLKAWADSDDTLKPVGGAGYLAQLVKAANTLDGSAAEGSGEDRLWDRQTECLGGLQVDHQLEGRRLLDRQIGRLGAGENPADIDSNLTPGAGEAGSIAAPAATDSRHS
jgi:DnaB-like helicase N terminal domain